MKSRLILILVLAAGAGRISAAEPKASPAAPAPTVPAPVAPKSPAASRRGAPAAATAAAAPRNDSLVTPSATFDTFRLITDRNIFNPNRTGRRERIAEAPPRSDTITLVGTMDSDKGLRAFFDVVLPRSRPSQAVHVGESVDQFKVTTIAPKLVTVEHDGKTFSMHMGQQFRRPPGGDWDLVGEDVVLREAQERAATEARVDPNAPAAIPANASPIERMLIERRNASLKK